MTEQELKWHRRFLDVCFECASWSKDRSTKTGCVIVKDRRILTSGYNGFTYGINDEDDYNHTRPRKYSITEHCDRNAIYQAARFGIALEGTTMYLTGPPCHDCSRGVVMAGIKEVVWPFENAFETGPAKERWADSIKVSFEILEAAKVKMTRVDHTPKPS